MADDVWTGKRYRTDPLTGEEAASHRQMFEEVSDSWKLIDEAVQLARGLNTLVRLLKFAGGAFAMAAAVGAFMATQGWL